MRRMYQENEMIFVIAGNHNEATFWINESIRKKQQNGVWSYPSEYTYVSDVDKIRGYRNPHGVFYGSWRQRPDIKMIMEQLYISTDHTQASYYTLSKLILELI